jgi:hypothetical protein
MITPSRMTMFAAAMLSVGVATHVSDADVAHRVGTEMQWARGCDLQPANCGPIVLAAAKDDDWTAWGGAMRGVEK